MRTTSVINSVETVVNGIRPMAETRDLVIPVKSVDNRFRTDKPSTDFCDVSDNRNVWREREQYSVETVGNR